MYTPEIFLYSILDDGQESYLGLLKHEPQTQKRFNLQYGVCVFLADVLYPFDDNTITVGLNRLIKKIKLRH